MKLSIQDWMLSGLALGLATTSSAQAQIVPDATLPNNSSVTTEGNTRIITEGTKAGSNLFHSFEQFSLPTGSTAYFNNAPEIQNILSRVTGSSVSSIDGLLQANDTANLFLMNPNGILFGPNASLNIGGSFIATTANAIQLSSAGTFSASEPKTSNLLSVNPSALFFNAIAAQGITNRSQAHINGETNSLGSPVGLQVPTDQTLALVGGDVVLEGGNLTAKGGRIELGSVAGPNLVSLTPTDKGQSLGYEGIQNFRDIQLSQQAIVDASGTGGGDIQVRGRQVTLTGGSSIATNTLGAEPGGTLNVIASVLVEAIGTNADGQLPSGLFTTVYPRATGNGSNLTVETRQLIIRDGAQVGAGTFGEGRAGNLTVTASESVEAIGNSPGSIPSFLFTNTQGAGAGSDLTINTEKLRVQDGAQVLASTFGKGQGGDLTVNASESVQIREGDLFADTRGTGAAGNFAITTGKLLLQGGQIGAGTLGDGQGGTLTVRASESVELVGTLANPIYLDGLTTQTQGAGEGGDLRIITGKLVVRDGASIRSDTTVDSAAAGDLRIETGQLIIQNSQIGASTFAKGKGGNLDVIASESIELIGTSAKTTAGGDVAPSGLFAQANKGAEGTSGNLTIETKRLSARDGGQVAASTFGPGNAGNLTVRASEVELAGVSANGEVNSGFFAETEGAGAAGDLRVEAERLVVRDGAEIGVDTTDTGQGGKLDVVASESIELIGVDASDRSPSSITATTSGAKAAGDLTIDARQLIVRDGARVAVSSEGTGNAGNLNVLSPSIRLDNQATLTAETSAGKGNIFLDSQDMVLRRGSNITTSATGKATGGNINIDTDVLAALENSDITANAQEAFGGRVIINAQAIFRSLDSDITATSELGSEFSGIVEINTPDVELQGSLTQLSANFISPEQVVAGSCLARRNVEQGSFVVAGTGGLPRNPYEAISGRYTVTGVQPIQGNGSVSQSAEVVGSTAWKKGDPIQEAQGMVVTADGRTIVGTALQLVALAKAQNLVCQSN